MEFLPGKSNAQLHWNEVQDYLLKVFGKPIFTDIIYNPDGITSCNAGRNNNCARTHCENILQVIDAIHFWKAS